MSLKCFYIEKIFEFLERKKKRQNGASRMELEIGAGLKRVLYRKKIIQLSKPVLVTGHR